MSRRIACVSLREIRLELAGEFEHPGERPTALAVVVARRGSAVKTERDVLGNTRIDFVSAEARVFGLRPGQTVAAARAKCADLRVRVVAENAVSSALARVAEALLAFGPTTSFDVAEDVVWVDVTGCAHLAGGEVELTRAIESRVRSMGHACRVAVADGPRTSAAVARFGRSAEGHSLVVAQGQGGAAVRALPIAALQLDDDARSWLAELGLKTCGDLQKLPRRALGARLGARSSDVMGFLDGCDAAPLAPWRPPEVPEERYEFDWGASSIEALTFVLRRLSERLALRLEGRGVWASRLEIVLTLDRALCIDAAPGAHRVVLDVSLGSPLTKGGDLFDVARARLERCSLEAPVVALTLRAPELARAGAKTVELFDAQPRAEQALPRLVAELAAEMGAESVGTLSLVDTWSPCERTRLVPFGTVVYSPVCATSTALEPTRLLPPERLPGEALDRAAQRGLVFRLARFEATEWWRIEPSARRDFFAAWLDGALAWLELRGAGAAGTRGRCGERAPLLLLRGVVD